MPSFVTSIVLQWSPDPLSDTTPTWTTIDNAEIRDIEWWAGIDREGNDPEPGGMTVTLKNVARKWEPLFGSNLIDTQQRFRLTLNGTQEGVWYTESFDLDYPSGQEFSWVTITCGDGFTVLAQDDLPGLDPPEAESYEDVVNFDEPWGYWRLGDPPGTQAVANFRRVLKGKGKNRRKVKVRRGTRYITAGETGATAGPAGIYKTISLVTLGEDGVILGDRDTSVKFDTSGGAEGRVAIPIEDGDSMNVSDGLSVECWVKTEVTTLRYLVVAPRNNAEGPPWVLSSQASAVRFTVRVAPSTDIATVPATLTNNVWHHVVGTYSGGRVRMYVNGALESEVTGAGGPLVVPTAGNSMFIAFSEDANEGFDGWLDEVAVYEHELSAERVLAHYQAGAERGFPQQTAGARIDELADTPLWATNSVGDSRDVLPIMQHGQSRLGEIADTVHSEGPLAMFFFKGDGSANYLGAAWQATSSDYNTVQWTFTDDGTGKPYNHVQLEYDFETFNEVVASHESGESVIVTDATVSGKRGRRVNSEYTDVLLVEHHDVEALAAGVLDYYKEPAKRPVSLTIDGYHCLAQILDLDIGHLIKVTKQGETGAATERVCHIIAKKKTMQMVTGGGLVSATYTLSRGFDPTGGTWILGYDGYSELGQTTELA